MKKQYLLLILSLLITTYESKADPLEPTDIPAAGSFIDSDGNDPTAPGCVTEYGSDDCQLSMGMFGEYCIGNTVYEYRTGTGPGSCGEVTHTAPYNCQDFCASHGHAKGTCVTVSNYCHFYSYNYDSAKCACTDPVPVDPTEETGAN